MAHCLNDLYFGITHCWIWPLVHVCIFIYIGFGHGVLHA